MNNKITLSIRYVAAVLAGIVTLQTCGAMEMVDIGDIGNPDNTSIGSGIGRVDYRYRIGKFEVTAEEYRDFLNSVGSTVVDQQKPKNYLQSFNYMYCLIPVLGSAV